MLLFAATTVAALEVTAALVVVVAVVELDRNVKAALADSSYASIEFERQLEEQLFSAPAAAAISRRVRLRIDADIFSSRSIVIRSSVGAVVASV